MKLRRAKRGRPSKANGAGSRSAKPAGFREVDYRAQPVQLLHSWLERRVITQPLYEAGNRFHCQVISMHEPCLQAMPLVKVRVDLTLRPMFAHPKGGASDASRRIVYEALQQVGGLQSGTASVLYHVVGLEWPIARWCQAVGSDRDPRFASGMLVSALEMLSVIPLKQALEKKSLTRRGMKS